MFDVGDDAVLRVATLDGDRNLVDVADIGLVVTRPDGTATGTLTPDHDSLGKYSYTFPTVQAGRHVARWAGAGYAHTEVFNVWPADPRFLISVSDAKLQIGRSDQRSMQDEDVRLFIAAVTPVIEDITGPLIATLRTRTFDGGDSALLLEYPVTAVSVQIGGISTTAFDVDETAGIVYSKTGKFPRGRRNIVVTYTAGRQVIPPNLILAARREFQFLWNSMMSSQHPGMSTNDEGVEYTPSGFAVPRQVIELCAPHQRLGGVA